MGPAVFHGDRTTLCLRGGVVTVGSDGLRIAWGFAAREVLRHPDGVFAYGPGAAAFLRDSEREPERLGDPVNGFFMNDNAAGMVLKSGSIVCAGLWVQWWKPGDGRVVNVAKLQSEALDIIDDTHGGFAVLTRGGALLWWPAPFSEEPSAVLPERAHWRDDVPERMTGAAFLAEFGGQILNLFYNNYPGIAKERWCKCVRDSAKF